MGNLIFGPWLPVDAPTLDIQTFARHKGVSVQTVRRWVREGMPVDRSVRSKPRFNDVACSRWLDERKVA